jgi:Fe-S-cluster-containing hydrogenase component 2/CRP-like cAMP-binding protein
MARVKVKPPARLERRPGDEELTIEQLKQISLFAGLSRPVDLEQFPGTVLLQRFEKGEAICRQNEPGWTAFYILTTKDLLELRQSQRKALPEGGASQQRVQQLEHEITRLQQTSSILQQLGPEHLPAVATAHVATPVLRAPGLRNTLRQTLGGILSRTSKLLSKRPPGTLVEGELFGEMSCLYRIPRSATVVAESEFYALTFLRNILDKMYANKAFKDQLDAIYRKRILELHLRHLPVFRDLPPDVFRSLRDRVELMAPLEPGDLICDEHDRPDSMYFIRSGFVKVLKNASFLLGAEAIGDWQGFCTAVQTGGQEASGARRKIWDLLSDEACRAAIARAAAGTRLAAEEQQRILFAFNDLLKQPKLQAHAEFKEFVQSPALSGMGKLPAGVKKWSQHQQVCAFNRRLLAAIYPNLILPPNHSSGSGKILDYHSPGDYLGEMGLMHGTPRTATCVAYVHHGEGKAIHGRVELVRISKELFAEIMRSSPDVGKKVAQVGEARKRSTERVMSLPVWQETESAALSVRFDDLGLIQGQKLMLIDLDRCTRCDKCVEACVKSHEQHWWDRLLPQDWLAPSRDGRSRLFLDGPRFTLHDGTQRHQYLVPNTCRQCRDPICLVGCPVGSIHKGDSGQIVIEDWCIGCSRCAEQCPYGAIQMHAVGIVERGGRGWRLRSTSTGPWVDVESPFQFSRDLRQPSVDYPEILLRRTFELTAAQCAKSRSFRLQVLSQSPRLAVHFNGQPVLAPDVGDKIQPGKETEALLGLASAAAVETMPGESPPQRVLRIGRNTIEATVTPTSNDEDVLLDLGLYAFTKPVVDPSMAGEFSQEVVTKKAVVCDMCGSTFGQQPACVNACPHDAAMRVDARTFFRLAK